MAPYEADAQISFLMKEGHVDLVISEDSDLLAFRCAKVCLVLPVRKNISYSTRYKNASYYDCSTSSFEKTT